MNKYYIKIQLLFIIILFSDNTIFSQTSNKILFDSLYKTTLKLFEQTRNTSQENINKAQIYALNDIQKAKINFIRTRIDFLYYVDPLLKNNSVVRIEKGDSRLSAQDTVIKYSELCIQMSEKERF